MKSEEKPPEPLFLEFRISDVLDSNKRTPRAEPWISRYCTAISEKRYGDAIFARYHMDGRAKDGIYTDTRDDSCETYQISVFDLIMKDAREFARDCPDLYQKALKLYSTTSPNDAHLDIIERLNQINVGFGSVIDRILSWVRWDWH
ncbi:hypothetical protein N7451_006423 [Penicillium sp. IBT 35674x]|nr:hypothetical protein N7451_006423 [Penicillium sp. IBT 35674x]